MDSRSFALSVAIGSIVALAGAGARADSYLVDPSSYLTLGGAVAGTGTIGSISVPLLGSVPGTVTASGSAALSEQAPGSLRAALGGTIDATVNGGSLIFGPTTRIEALPTGNWAPSGAPSSLAGQAQLPLAWSSTDPLLGSIVPVLAGAAGLQNPTVLASTRGLAATIGGTATLAGAPGTLTFGLGALGSSFLAGTVDASMAFLQASFDLAGSGGLLSAGLGGTLAGDTLRIPVNWSGVFVGSGSSPITSSTANATGELSGSFSLAIQGEIVATRVLAPVPEPSTYALMAAGLCVIGLLARRRMPGRH